MKELPSLWGHADASGKSPDASQETLSRGGFLHIHDTDRDTKEEVYK